MTWNWPAGAGAWLAAVESLEPASRKSAPDVATLAAWAASGTGRSPDGCPTAPDGCCEHGLASWWLVALAERDRASRRPGSGWDRALALPHPDRLDLREPTARAALSAHDAALEAAAAGYTDPVSGLFVLTARRLRSQAACCERGCRHCPWLALSGGRPAARSVRMGARRGH